jgi:putative nucleotidyltransferase with HDIG domain
MRLSGVEKVASERRATSFHITGVRFASSTHTRYPVGMNRDDAYALVCEYTQSDSLRKHMLAVEAAVRAYARKFGEDEEKWGIVGLLHDFDYERWPDPPDHPLKGAAILAERGYPDEVIYAIKSHADYLPDCPRVSKLDKTLYACDELAGFIGAVAMVRPEGIAGMQASSVKKKLKQKSFAAAVKREDIVAGAADLGVDLDEHIQFVIDALVPHAQTLGLGPRES